VFRIRINWIRIWIQAVAESWSIRIRIQIFDGKIVQKCTIEKTYFSKLSYLSS
jgi:hypothetical protein